MLTFTQFCDFVMDDLAKLGINYEDPSLAAGFRNFVKETGRADAGYLFELPTVQQAYNYCPKDGWYYRGIGSSGRGQTLVMAIADSESALGKALADVS